MQAIVDKVIRALTVRPPVVGDAPRLAPQEATEIAAELLENLKRQMALRTQRTSRR
jgi:hypothetical protein